MDTTLIDQLAVMYKPTKDYPITVMRIQGELKAATGETYPIKSITKAIEELFLLTPAHHYQLCRLI